MRDFLSPQNKGVLVMDTPKEGALYKALEIFDHRIELKYGYYEERERARGEPIPIYPDFKSHPLYTKEGYPLVTQMQGLCTNGSSPYEDGCCVDCTFYVQGEDLIGICKNSKNRQERRK